MCVALILFPGLVWAAPTPFTPPDPAQRVALKDGVWTMVDASCPALPADDGLRQRIVDVAAEEWARFGFQTEEILRIGLSVVERPEHGSVIARALNRVKPGVTRRVMRLGRMEDSRSVAAVIGGYWAAAPDGAEAVDIQNRLRAAYPDVGWAVPWSAAFVSYVMCASGVGDLDQFHRSQAHWEYVDQAIDAADGKAPQALYRARDITSGLPQPGDLVCLDRTVRVFRSVADKRAAPGEAAMHCDIVVKVDRKARLAAVIGGNVEQSVTMTLVNILPSGGGRPARLQTLADIPGARPYFMIMALTLGGAAKLDAAPAIRRIAAPPPAPPPAPRTGP